ncbi:MAG: Holliday junction resolvase Hjc [Candidatus Pacearchaeota archaeon]
MNKKRGADAERELLHLLSKKFAVARVAGSGTIKETSCDLLAGKEGKGYAIEVKISKGNKKYIKKEQVNGLIDFANKFGLKPLIAIKFLRKGWYFIEPEKLTKTEKALYVSLHDIKKKGKSFEELIEKRF